MTYVELAVAFILGANVGTLIGARLATGPLFIVAPDELVPVCGLCGNTLAAETPAGELVRYRGALCHTACYTAHRGSNYAARVAADEDKRERRRRAIMRRQRRGNP